jgi:propionyl-CoA synthetase
VLAHHSDVAEAVVIGKTDSLRGHVPIGLVVLSDNARLSPEEICNQCVAMVREKIGAVAFFRTCIPVSKLPKTRSGKILRGVLRKIVDGEEYLIPPTIEDPNVFGDLEKVLRNLQ